jgi:hypothetical protein
MGFNSIIYLPMAKRATQENRRSHRFSNPQLLKMQADEQHAKTIVNGISRIGYMTGGRAAHWVDSDMSDTFLGKALEFIKTNKDASEQVRQILEEKMSIAKFGFNIYENIP